VLIVSTIAEILVTFFLAALGLALLGYFTAHSGMVEPGQTISTSADKLFPRFIVSGLPVGVSGLIIAGLLAAAMSSLSSGINASCSVIVRDFFQRFSRRPLGDADQLRLARRISWVVGAFVVALSVGVNYVPGNLYEIAGKVVNLLTAPLFVLFMMAMFVPWATTFGTLVAEACSLAAAILIAYWDVITGRPGIGFQWILPASLVTGAVVGMLASLLPIGAARPALQEEFPVLPEPTGET
jgi:SSS family solute:Na+ symporter